MSNTTTERNYFTAIIDELERVKFWSGELDKQVRLTKGNTDDLAYVLKKLEEISNFLTEPLR